MSQSIQHQIRNQLAVIVGGIDTNNLELVKAAARKLDALCFHLDSLAMQEALDETDA